MKVSLVLLLCILVVAVSLPTRRDSKKITGNTEGPEDAVGKEVLVWISKHKDYIEKVLQRRSTFNPEDLSAVFHRPGSPKAEECDGCVVFVDLVRLILRLGLEYEDVEDLAIEVCVGLLEFEGYVGEVICPGVVPNYGPHLFTIFDATQNTSAEICEVLEYCDLTRTTVFQRVSKPKPLHTKQRGMNKHTHITENVLKRASKAQGILRQKRQAEIIKIAHITDIHVEAEYVPGSATECGLHMCCRNETTGTGSAGPWGEWTCNIPPQTVQRLLSFIAELQPDILIESGDTPSNAVWAETNERQINSSVWLAHQVAQYLPGVPAFFTIGNHETFPTNLYFAPNAEVQLLHEAFIDHWGPLAGFEQEQKDTLRAAGYYSVVVRPGLRILSWNSNFGAGGNWYNILNHYRDEYFGMLQYVETTLAQARQDGEKVIVISHHPVGGGLKYYTEWETQLVVDYGDVIVLHAQGHSHSDNFDVFVDPNTMEPRSFTLSSSSMSTSPEKNPTCRMLYMDSNTMELLDYEHYSLYLGNIDDGMVEDPEISLLYSAVEDYGLTNLTASGWLDFIFRMSEDEDLFNHYYLNHQTGVQTQVDCTGDCRIDHLCGLINTVDSASIDCPLRIEQ